MVERRPARRRSACVCGLFSKPAVPGDGSTGTWNRHSDDLGTTSGRGESSTSAPRAIGRHSELIRHNTGRIDKGWMSSITSSWTFTSSRQIEHTFAPDYEPEVRVARTPFAAQQPVARGLALRDVGHHDVTAGSVQL